MTPDDYRNQNNRPTNPADKRVGLVMCKDCFCITVEGNFCRACGESVTEARKVDLPRDLREDMGTGYYRYNNVADVIVFKD